VIVKICGITNRDDAELSVDAGAAAIGFNFYRQSPRYISPAAAAIIGENLPITKVGVFVNEPAASVARIALEANLDVAQLHGTSQALGIRIWRAWRAGQDPSAEDLWAAEAMFIDTPSNTLYGGTGETFDWSVARGLPHKIVVAGGLHATNVATAIQQAEPWGVDACSRLERIPGLKDHQAVREFVKAALAAASSLNL
jgi:phosphoribosylanthranilate isomerase